jgi:hypothetical protein
VIRRGQSGALPFLLSLIVACDVRTRQSTSSDIGSSPHTVEFETDEGTDMNVDVSPDGKEIAFDLLGDIYTVPISGGDATLRVGGADFDSSPRYAPDGKSIAFLSDRTGEDAVWTADRAGQNPTLIASGGGELLRSLAYAPDGTQLGVRWGTSKGLALIDPASRVIKPALDTTRGRPNLATFFQSAWFNIAPAGRGKPFYLGERPCDAKRRTIRIVSAGESSSTLRPVTDSVPGARDYKPTLSRSGKWLGFFRIDSSGVVTLRARNLESKVERSLTTFPEANEPCRDGSEDTRSNFAFTPDDSAIVIAKDGKLQRVELDGGAATVIPFRAHVTQAVAAHVPPKPRSYDADSFAIRAIRAPVVAPDGRIVFTALGKLWLRERTGGIRRLTSSNELEHSGILSPDGRWVAYLAYTDSMSSLLQQRSSGKNLQTLANRVMVIGLDSAAHTARALTTVGDYGALTWIATPEPSLLATKLEPDPKVKAVVQARFLTLTLDGRQTMRGVAPKDYTVDFGHDVSGRLGRQVDPKTNRVYYTNFSAPYRGVFRLSSIKLDGSDPKVHLVVPKFKSGVAQLAAISPDLTRLVLSNQLGGDLLLLPLTKLDGPADSIDLANSARARRITEGPLTSVAWQNDSVLTFAINRAVMTARLSSGRIESTHVKFMVARDVPRGTFAIRNARIITMAGARGKERVIDRGTLVVVDGLVTQVEEGDGKVPAGAIIVDGTGLTIIPGLGDMHMHLGLRTTPRPAIDQDDITCLAYGVTLRYDASTFSTESDLEHFERVTTGMATGPRYYYSGESLPSGLVDFDSVAARKAAAWYDSLDALILKGGFDWPRRYQRMWVQAARDIGVGITAHSEGMQQNLAMALDGYTAIEHAKWNAPLYKDVVTFLSRSGIHHTPTTGLLHRGWQYYYDDMIKRSPADTIKLSRFMDVAKFGKFMDGIGREPLDKPFDQLHLGRIAKSLVALDSAGLALSIDGHNPPGILTHWAIWTLAEAGASNMAALRAGTLGPARKVGLDRQLGTIEVGKLADFVVLTANPLENIRNTLAIKYVVANGRIYDAETMATLWPKYTTLPRMGVLPEAKYRMIQWPGPLQR